MKNALLPFFRWDRFSYTPGLGLYVREEAVARLLGKALPPALPQHAEPQGECAAALEWLLWTRRHRVPHDTCPLLSLRPHLRTSALRPRASSDCARSTIHIEPYPSFEACYQLPILAVSMRACVSSADGFHTASLASFRLAVRPPDFPGWVFYQLMDSEGGDILHPANGDENFYSRCEGWERRPLRPEQRHVKLRA
jgi:hypothetical protein